MFISVSFQRLLVPSAWLFQLLEQGEDYFKLSPDLISENRTVVIYFYASLCWETELEVG